MLADLARHIEEEKSEFLFLPEMCFHAWLAGGQAAAVCVGAWCLSSNPWNPPGGKADCGGLGWIISAIGDVMTQTDPGNSFTSLQIDIEFSRRSKSSYPRYVAE